MLLYDVSARSVNKETTSRVQNTEKIRFSSTHSVEKHYMVIISSLRQIVNIHTVNKQRYLDCSMYINPLG